VSILAALYRLLSILAVVGLALSPVFASANGVGAGALMAVAAENQAPIAGSVAPTEMSVAASDDMPCCEHDKPATPDCGKLCPLAALCFSACALVNVAGQGIPVRTANSYLLHAANEVAPDSLSKAPPPRPPRA
jgi:hypothetical protein